MKAMEICEQDRIDREAGTPLPRQQYYTALTDALHRELMQRGCSDLLEALLLDLREGTLQRIYVLDYAALMECHSMIVLGREMRDATEFVPHLHLRGEKARWEALEGPGAFLMPVTREMAEKFRQLRAVSRQLVEARNETVAPQADDAARQEIEQIHTLNRLLDERCRSLQQERDELQARLRQMEEGVITEQVRYAIEARRIQEEEALRRKYDAEREDARRAFRAQYAAEQTQERRRLEEEARCLNELRAEAARCYTDHRREMAADLRELTSLLAGKVMDWEAPTAAECRMLAGSYVALHDVWSEGMDKLVLDAECADAPAEVVTAIRRMQQLLHDRVRQLEQAMVRLGLTVLRPRAGDVLDGALHLPVGTSAGAVGDVKIARCVRPGVMLTGAAEALVKAEVETE